jgi:hypothetical protein
MCWHAFTRQTATCPRYPHVMSARSQTRPPRVRVMSKIAGAWGRPLAECGTIRRFGRCATVGWVLCDRYASTPSRLLNELVHDVLVGLWRHHLRPGRVSGQ